MITALYLPLLILPFVVQGYQPACPNNQRPKTDGNGNPLQCLPGASQRTICGMDHDCFFSGINYMCCPSNEPSPENQPICPEPAMTVLDAHGLAMKCSPRSRICPGENMYCSDVGMAYICCEKAPEQPKREPVVPEKKTRRRKTKKTPAPTTLECPTGSIGVLDQNLDPRYCNSQIKCPGWGQFCHGGLKKSICCEKYMFADNILDTSSVATTTTTTAAAQSGFGSFVESQSPQKPRTINIAMRPSPRRNSLQQVPLEGSTSQLLSSAERMSMTKDVQERLHNGSFESRAASQVSFIKKKKKKTTTTTTTTEIPTTTTSEPTTEILEVIDDDSEPIIVFTPTTTEPTTTTTKKSTRRRMQGIKTHGLPNAENFQPIKNGETSLLRTREDKRVMAQEFLMNQIRNGWPYDDKFYRPDNEEDTREPQLPLDRPNVAQLRFLNN